MVSPGDSSTTSLNKATTVSKEVKVNAGTGIITAGGFNATSDYRIKERLKSIITPIDYLNPLHYYNKKTNREDMGFIAHEVQEHFPFLVSGEKDGENYQSLNYIGLIPLLTKEIQDLKKDKLKLSEEIYKIKSRLDILESNK